MTEQAAEHAPVHRGGRGRHWDQWLEELRALPAEDPQRLVMLSNPEYHGIGVGDGSGKRGMYAYPEFRDLLDKNQVFSGMLAVDSYVRRTDITVVLDPVSRSTPTSPW